MRDHKFRRTTLLCVYFLAVLVGLVVGRKLSVPFFLALLATGSTLMIFRHRSIMSLSFVLLAGFLLGGWRGAAVFQEIQGYEPLLGQSVQVKGVVLDDPVYDDSGQFDFRVGEIVVDGESMYGQLRVKGRVLDITRGDTVDVGGQLREGFGNYQAAVYFANVQVTQKSNSLPLQVRSQFFSVIYTILPEPQASLALGFLVGLRSTLPEDFEQQLRIAGLTHIVVASGYNLTILVRIARRVFARWSRYQALAASLMLVAIFIMISGASPSIVRAGVVTVLSLLAWYYGRSFKPLLILSLSAALTAFYNPLYIWSDLGWWLSFLAFSGVMILAPLLSARLFKHKHPPLLAQIAIESFAAQLMTVPLVLYVFGDISLVALAANLAVVPLIPLTMLASFIAGLSYIIIGKALALLTFPANILLSYIVSVSQLFAAPPWAQRSFQLGAMSMILTYGTIITVIFILHTKVSHKKSFEYSIIE